jgi:chorismate mutase
MPELPIICDPSHISGTTELIAEVSQTALDLGMDGLMIETHHNPSLALSDAKQQLTPDSLSALMNNLVLRKTDFDDTVHLEKLRIIRKHIDGLDEKLLSLLAERLALVSEIGAIKKENNVMIFQLKRFFEILKTRKALGDDLGLPKDLVHELFELIHKHSINIQNKI